MRRQVSNPQSPVVPKQEETTDVTRLSWVSGHSDSQKTSLTVMFIDDKLGLIHYVGKKSCEEAPTKKKDHKTREGSFSKHGRDHS